MSAKHVHDLEVALCRTINGNLDGSLDQEQALHLILAAAKRAIPREDILVAFHRSVGDSIDGVPVTSLVDQALAHQPRRRDN